MKRQECDLIRHEVQRQTSRKQNFIIGTNKCADDGEVMSQKEWLHLSSFKPTQSALYLINLIVSNQKVSTNKIVCFKLVKKGDKEESLSHINFKMGVPSEYIAAAFNSNYWPAGVRVRRFRFIAKKIVPSNVERVDS